MDVVTDSERFWLIMIFQEYSALLLLYSMRVFTESLPPSAPLSLLPFPSPFSLSFSSCFFFFVHIYLFGHFLKSKILVWRLGRLYFVKWVTPLYIPSCKLLLKCNTSLFHWEVRHSTSQTQQKLCVCLNQQRRHSDAVGISGLGRNSRMASACLSWGACL